MVTWLDDPDPARGHWSVTRPRFEVGSVGYQCSYGDGSTIERFLVKKAPALVQAHLELLARFPSANVVELGISQGGSTALMAQVADARRLVAIELSPDPVPALAELIAREDLGATVHPHYGVDQADRARLIEILDDEFGTEPLDLVIDDASHLLAETRVSFDVLFPRLRPGGCLVIEDWNWQHLYTAGVAADEEAGRRAFEAALGDVLADPSHPLHDAAQAAVDEALTADPPPESPPPAMPWDGAPLTRLVLELVLARAASGDVVAGLTIDESWVVVERGPAPLDPATFSLAAVVADPFGLLGG